MLARNLPAHAHAICHGNISPKWDTITFGRVFLFRPLRPEPVALAVAKLTRASLHIRSAPGSADPWLEWQTWEADRMESREWNFLPCICIHLTKSLQTESPCIYMLCCWYSRVFPAVSGVRLTVLDPNNGPRVELYGRSELPVLCIWWVVNWWGGRPYLRLHHRRLQAFPSWSQALCCMLHTGMVSEAYHFWYYIVLTIVS